MKIFCVGRNYAEHARELNNELPSTPVIFMKPETALITNDRKNEFYIPEFSEDLQHEVEIIIRICKTGKYILPEFTHEYFEEISLGIDFTARDIQKNLREKGLPWEISKAFDNSALVGDFYPKEDFDLNNLEFTLYKNKLEQQKGNTVDMVFKIEELIAYISQFFTLKAGDLIFTGTPRGVSSLREEDFLEGYIENKKIFEINIC